MKIRLFLLVGLLFAAMSVQAKTYRLEGKVGDKYPIVMELEEHDNGLFSGRYAYRSTLRRNGDVRCSWLYINPDIDNPYSRWIVSDCKHEQVELWYDVNFNGRRLIARMKNKAGKYYDIAASVAGQSNVPNFSGGWESTNPNFRLTLSLEQHSGNVKVIVCQIYRTYAWEPTARIRNGKLILDDPDSEFPFHAEFVLRNGKLAGQCRAFGGPKETNFSGNLTLIPEIY